MNKQGNKEKKMETGNEFMNTFMNSFMNVPLNILPSSFNQIDFNQIDFKNLSFSQNTNSGFEELVERNGDIAIMHLEGVFLPRVSFFYSYYGYISTLDMMELYRNLVKDESVRRIILYVNSPGGVGQGIKEFSDLIYNSRMKKETVSYVDEMAASAGYWVASASENLVVAPQAMIGSIGTYIKLVKYNLEMFGMDIEGIHAGKKKLYGDPTIQKTEDEVNYFEDVVQKHNQMFLESVARNRDGSVEVVQNLEAEAFYAEDAPNWLYTQIGNFNLTLS